MVVVVKKEILRRVYRPRKRWSYKYDYGHLLVVGGSKLYSGSPAFAALAAYRAGVDLVTIAAPQRVADIIAGFSPDLIAYPLKGDCLTPAHLKELSMLSERANAIAIGGGLERDKKTMLAVRKFLEQTNLPCVVDADAIHAIALQKRCVLNKPFVLTPHTFEFYVLSGIKLERRLEGRAEAVKEVARKLGTTILLKGFVDIISDGKRVALNKTGCPELTVGGTGDTLTGIVGALLARGCDCFEAACAAAYLNGLAGQRAVRKFGEGVMASDLLNELPLVLRT
jgi:NAD(P)H-hydrate epimerase